MPSYFEKEYWESRFQTEDTFEWLMDTQTVEKNVFPKLRLPEASSNPSDFVVLNAGCGSSRFPADLTELYPSCSVINVDYSEVVVAKQKQKFPSLDFRVDDLLKLDTVGSASIDLIFDKSSMDALACSGYTEMLLKYQAVLARVAKLNCQWALISYSNRSEVIDKNLWKLMYLTEIVVREAETSPARPEIVHWIHILEPAVNGTVKEPTVDESVKDEEAKEDNLIAAGQVQ